MNQFTLILIPFEKITFETNLSALEIKQKLEENINSQKNKSLKFKGRVKLDSFKLTKEIAYMNSFKPVIVGKINENITIVKISQRLSIVSFLFLLVWTTFATVAFFSIFHEINSGNWYNFLFVLLGYFISIIGFKMESIQTRIQLEKLLEAKK